MPPTPFVRLKIKANGHMDYLRNFPPFADYLLQGGGGGGGGDFVFFQFEKIPPSTQTGITIEITTNGGLLPLTNDNIFILSPFGVIASQLIGDDNGFIIDRVSMPNRLLLPDWDFPDEIKLLIVFTVPA